ncbi:MAG: hypothetical protein RMJ59_04035 [Candidatus Nitrosocaldus sp.]|nr:PepSY domain-containing protein [Candidatus Nitrosocaldus sp.]MCS7141114.1 PepSY domain-containing protein [Candidatus Nitrosocaldus sp.]MDW8000078.1 hypothetical protein [Candidatus Nitrosocaldus sp.]MDW8275535.1 hypothetical protein [Candidatus Nitrosocaldus sp.]
MDTSYVRWYKKGALLAAVIGVVITVALITPSLVSVIAQSSTNGTSGNGSTVPQLQGSVNVQNSILANVNVRFSDAANTAANVVTNGTVLSGRLTIAQNYLVYEFIVLDSNSKVHKVIVDAGDGRVLYTSDGFDASIMPMLGGHKHGYKMEGFHGKPMYGQIRGQ